MLGGHEYSISPWIVVFVDWFVVLYPDYWYSPYTLPSILLLLCCDPTLLLGTSRAYEMNIGDSLETSISKSISILYVYCIQRAQYFHKQNSWKSTDHFYTFTFIAFCFSILFNRPYRMQIDKIIDNPVICDSLLNQNRIRIRIRNSISCFRILIFKVIQTPIKIVILYS